MHRNAALNLNPTKIEISKNNVDFLSNTNEIIPAKI